MYCAYVYSYQIRPEGVPVGVPEAVGSVIYVPRVVFYGKPTGIARNEVGVLAVELRHCEDTHTRGASNRKEERNRTS